jgi:CubicO group peptidase (beta-lactamase class C family)
VSKNWKQKGLMVIVVGAGVLCAAILGLYPVPLFELRLDSGERGHRRRYERAIPLVHAQADLRASGHGPHGGRLRDRAGRGSGDVLLPQVRGGSSLRPGPDAPARLFLLRGIQRLPVDTVRPGALRYRDHGGKLLQAATVQLLQTSQKLRSGEETGYGLGWDLETAALAGKQTRLVGHDGDSLGGMVASLMTFPEHGIVVSVVSNISYADTFGVAVKIAQAFAEQGRTPARK